MFRLSFTFLREKFAQKLSKRIINSSFETQLSNEKIKFCKTVAHTHNSEQQEKPRSMKRANNPIT